MLQRTIFFLTVVLLVLYIIYRTLFSASYDTDNRYNMGLVLRSALPNRQWLLESSLLHWTFEQYTNPRPEDWHRGWSILLHTFWAHISKANEPLLRIPHLIWTVLWIGLTLKLFLLLSPHKRIPHQRWAMLLLVMILFFSFWNAPNLSRAFLDDIPASVVILIAIILLPQASIESWRLGAIIGALCGLAFGIKNLSGIWAGLIPFTIVVIYWREKRPLGSLIKFGIAFSFAWVLFIAPKLWWSLAENGTLLDERVLHWTRVASYSSFHAPNYPFFAMNDDSYRDPVALAGSETQAFVNSTLRTIYGFLGGVIRLWFVWFWLLPFVLHHRGIEAKKHERLTLMTVIAVAGFLILSLLGLGVGGALRYWIVPITLGVTIGFYHAWNVLWNKQLSERIQYGFLILLLFISNLDLGYRDGEAAHSVEIMQIASENLAPNEAIMLGLEEGFTYWSLQPQDNVLCYTDIYLISLPLDAQERLFNAYNVRIFLYNGPAIAFFEEQGYIEIARDANNSVVYRRP